MKSVTLSIFALLFSVASFGQIGPISGPSTVCVGSTGTYTDPSPGGTWTISPTSVATISSGAVVTAVSLGTATITYTISGSYVTYPITINPAPAPITGPSSVCTGSTITLADGTMGGAWSSSAPTVASVGFSTGIATGLAAGVTNISYTLGTGCYVTQPVTVNPLPSAITGPSTVCVGGSITLSSTGGGTWSGSSGIFTIAPTTGILTGVSAGVGTVSYTLPTGCAMTTLVTVNPLPTVYAVTGGGSYCSGGTGVHVGIGGSSAGVNYQLYLGGTPLGTALAGTGLALDFGLQTAAGTYTVVATNAITTCTSTMTGSATVTISPLPAVFTITGGGSYCAGGSGVLLGLSGSTIGVTYQLYNGTTAVGSPVAGTGSAISFGAFTPTGTYTVIASPGTSCATTMSGSAVIIVSPLPNAYAVTGGGSYCSGGSGISLGLAGSDLGVSYQLYMGGTPLGALVAGTGGVLSFGTYTTAGTYTVVATDLSTGCTNTMAGSVSITVSPLPLIFAVTGGGSYCAGGAGVAVGLSNSDVADNYELYNGSTSVGTLAGTGGSLSFGLETGAGTYSVVATDPFTGCSSAMSGSAAVAVNPLPAVTASASAPACGGVVTLTASGASSYSWSPSTGLSCSSCSSTTITPATSATITVTGTDALGCSNTATASVDGNNISGHITYTGSPSDVFTVWLIQFNPSDSSIHALDSTSSCMDAGIPYYEFTDPIAGNYMVKAKLNSAVPGTSGYIPTYSSSTPNWYAAASVAHTSTADIMDITMVYGTVPAGPGFISGYVVSGAGKGTAGDVPEPGMLIYLEDATGHLITYTYTDAAGAYSFNSIANGSYIIYPEDYKYYTTPSAIITLSPTSEIVNAVDFKKHTTFGTITPQPTSILSVAGNVKTACYPNPASGILNIDLAAHGNEIADVIVTNITGAVVYHNSLNLDAKQDKAQVDLSELTDGVYFINFRSGDINFTGKILMVK